MARQPLGSLGRLIFRGFTITHSDTPHSVGLLCTRDQLVAETSTWQHTTLTTDRHPCPGGIRNHNPSKQAAADLRLRPRGHENLLPSVNDGILTVYISPAMQSCLHTFWSKLKLTLLFLPSFNVNRNYAINKTNKVRIFFTVCSWNDVSSVSIGEQAISPMKL
jgi:hypothetical protein